MRLTVAETLAELEPHREALESLACAAAEPNPFYEPWMLFPALRTQPHGTLRMLIVWAQDPLKKTPSEIAVGFLPLEEQSKLYYLPVRHLMPWKHKYCFLCTPLVRKSFERDALAEIAAWAEEQRLPLHFKYITGEGPVYQALIDTVNTRSHTLFETFNRAMFRPRASAEDYLNAATSGVHRKEFRRHQRALAALGEVSCTTASTACELKEARETFLRVEASGWKGKDGTALASLPQDRQFFEELTDEGFARNHISLLTLRAGDRPVAVKCNLRSGDGSFAFKIGFDEELEKLSGMLMELENLRWLHENPEIRWMDSCANAVHFMINRLWLDRRTITTLVISPGTLKGDLVIPTLEWLKFAKTRFTKKDPKK